MRLISDDGIPICNSDPSTTVLAHIRRSGVAGTGQKPPDLIGVWACSECHDVLDGRSNFKVRDLDADTLDGLVRTLNKVSKEIGYG